MLLQVRLPSPTFEISVSMALWIQGLGGLLKVGPDVGPLVGPGEGPRVGPDVGPDVG